MTADEVRRLLRAVAGGKLPVDEALDRLRGLETEDLGFARVDHHREVRCGFPEVVFGAGKTPADTVAIARSVLARSDRLLVTRVPPESARALRRAFKDARHEERARCVVVDRARPRRAPAGRVIIVTAGTSDLPVAEEARVTAETTGSLVETIHDAGVAGIHRILGRADRLREARCVVVVAGMEGALASVVGGLCSVPVIACPTSVGYGASFGGLAALLAMLNSCAAGVAVVNIDNGFGAGFLASRINLLAPEEPPARPEKESEALSDEQAPAILALEDGTVFRGKSFGARGDRTGEVVFNTSLQGYQEILTDPSYKGQVVCMTYPLIGNYGVTPEDDESDRPWVEAFVVREACRVPSSHRSAEPLGTYLERNGVVGIEGIDTRMLTRRLREHGALRGVVSTEEKSADALVDRARSAPSMEGQDLVKVVTRKVAGPWTEGHVSAFSSDPRPKREPAFHVAAVDYGMKRNILRNLVDCGFRVTVLPATVSAEEVLAVKPDGVFLSNGPGDPAALPYAAACARGLLGRVPIFGICLGHQILAHAFGGKTFKLKFGHHGGNHPVKDLVTGKVEVTAQNHGFAAHEDLFTKGAVEQTHVNLNDGTCEGMRHREVPAFSVQYHPEAAPGPHDSLHLFDRFRALMEGRPAAV